MVNFGLKVNSKIPKIQIAHAKRALKLVRHRTSGERPIDLSTLIKIRMQEVVKDRMTQPENISESEAWQIFFDERNINGTVAFDLSKHGYLDPFQSVDPRNIVSRWAYEAIDHGGSDKQRLLMISTAIVRLYDTSKHSQVDRVNFDWENDENNVASAFFDNNNYLNKAGRDIRYSFLMLCIARACHFNSGISIDGKGSTSWVEIDGVRRVFDLQDQRTLEKMVSQAISIHNGDFEYNLPVLNKNESSARTILSIWHQLNGENYVARFKLSEAENIFVRAIEIDPDNEYCFDLLRELGERLLSNVGFVDAKTAINEYSQSRLSDQKNKLLERYAAQMSINMALTLAATKSGLLEWGRE